MAVWRTELFRRTAPADRLSGALKVELHIPGAARHDGYLPDIAFIGISRLRQNVL